MKIRRSSLGFLVVPLALFAGLSLSGVRKGAAAAARWMLHTDPMQATAEGSLLSSQDAQSLERQLTANPGDLILRSKLLGYYLLHHKGASRTIRQQHIIWLIRHAPAEEISGSPFAMLDPREDAAVLGQARQLWEQQIQVRPHNAEVLGNAAEFYSYQNAGRAEQLYRQAQALEPTNPKWAEKRGETLYQRSLSRTGEARRQMAQQALAQYETWDRYAEADDKSGDYSALPDMAMAAFEAGAFDKARQCANRLLDIAAHDSSAGNVSHHANVVLGRLALHSGEKAKACTYLLAAGRTPGSPQLDSFGPNMTLAKELLETGERQAVLDYLRLCAQFWKRPELEQWATEIKDGKMPNFGPHLRY